MNAFRFFWITALVTAVGGVVLQQVTNDQILSYLSAGALGGALGAWFGMRSGSP